MWIGRLYIGIALNGRVSEGEVLGSEERPWFGFYYGSWRPHWSNNGGKFKKKEVVDFNIRWLCFHGGFTWWGNSTRKQWRNGHEPKTNHPRLRKDDEGSPVNGGMLRPPD